MLYFGCLFALLLIIFFLALNLIGNVINSVWSITVYCWNSICNLFLPKNKRKDTRNPFETRDNSYTQNYNTSHNESMNPDGKPQGKIFNATDGEYIDFEEIK